MPDALTIETWPPPDAASVERDSHEVPGALMKSAPMSVKNAHQTKRVQIPVSVALTRYAPMVLCQIAVASYLIATIHLAGATSFWIDEVLAVWTARLPSSADVTAAIWKGAEFSPPTYDLLLHVLFKIFGESRFIARLPSIVGLLIAAGALGSIAWRRFGAYSAALTVALVLNSYLFHFAIQARPYSFVIAIECIATLLWSEYGRGGGDRWRAGGLALLLFLAVSLQFYAITALAVFGSMEVMWSFVRHRIRRGIWIALMSASVMSLAWLPLMMHLAAFNKSDAADPDFYAAPTLGHLVEHIQSLFAGSTHLAIAGLLAIFLVVGAYIVASSDVGLRRTRPHGDAPALEDRVDVTIISTALIAALPIGFGLALVATHAFSARYALTTTAGAILLVVMALRMVPYYRIICGILLCVLGVSPLLDYSPPALSDRAIDLIQHVHVPEPIVIGDAGLFIMMMEEADATTRRRLVYLTPLPGVTDADSTGARQLGRLRSFLPDLPVKDSLIFLGEHPTFVDLCHQNPSTDALCYWLAAKGGVDGVLGMEPGLMLSTIKTDRFDARRP